MPRFYGVLDTVKQNFDPKVGQIVEFSYDVDNNVFVPEVNQGIEFNSIAHIFGKYIATTEDGRVYDLAKKTYIADLEDFSLVF